MKTSTQLKPCPFCGSAEVFATHTEFPGGLRETVQCDNCGAIAARAVWGMRTEHPSPERSAAGRWLPELEEALRNGTGTP